MGIGIAGFNPDRPLGDREGSWMTGHGIASIGANLAHAGHEVSLIDLRQLGGWQDVAARIAYSDAEVFGLSIAPVDGDFAIPLAECIKLAHPQTKVIVGGIHPTIFPEKYDPPFVDCVVQGEGEVTFRKLLEMAEWPKLVFGEKPTLDELPWVKRDLFDYRREMSCNFAPDQQLPSITMLAGRGCPFRCTYCQPAENAVFGHPYRLRSPANVVAEMVMLHARYGYKSVTFWDDTFTINKNWVMRFCDLYEQHRIGASIAACSRADIICKNEAMIERMASVGVDWFVIGLESGSQRILDLIQKGTTVQQNLEAAKICRKYGIKIFGTYMYGLPTETNAEALETARMIDEIAPEHPSPFYFVPIQGTSIYDFCESNDLLLDGARQSIARTGVFQPAIRHVDYDFLNQVREGYRA